MKTLATIKSEESAKLAADYADWLNAGHKPQQLPGVGSGHTLTKTYSLRNHDAASSIKAGVKP